MSGKVGFRERAEARFHFENWRRLKLDYREENWQFFLACFEHILRVSLKEIVSMSFTKIRCPPLEDSSYRKKPVGMSTKPY